MTFSVFSSKNNTGVSSKQCQSLLLKKWRWSLFYLRFGPIFSYYFILKFVLKFNIIFHTLLVVLVQKRSLLTLNLLLQFSNLISGKQLIWRLSARGGVIRCNKWVFRPSRCFIEPFLLLVVTFLQTSRLSDLTASEEELKSSPWTFRSN